MYLELISKSHFETSSVKNLHSMSNRKQPRIFLSVLLVLLCITAQAQTRIIHVCVALCDNDSQGIVPVPKKIGNGNDPNQNLYWGCGYGVRTFFTNAGDWQKVATVKNAAPNVLERCVFKHRRYDVILVADAFRGARIRQCTEKFLDNASGNCTDTLSVNLTSGKKLINLGDAQLVCYVGHDGLMDFSIDNPPKNKGGIKKDVIILACVSRSYYREAVKLAGANPLLWTTGLMAPEAYTLKAAVDGWILKEDGQSIRKRAAEAYNQYQKCGIKGAMNLFATGW
ncbi:MAG: hypothetical protein FD123_2595 [Bacteroidetes bacterium]|nr:MAG: hypothetical protein FD123_2595 [Bacteroidota bacterium]